MSSLFSVVFSLIVCYIGYAVHLTLWLGRVFEKSCSRINYKECVATLRDVFFGVSLYGTRFLNNKHAEICYEFGRV